jgi:hypothetical protein
MDGIGNSVKMALHSVLVTQYWNCTKGATPARDETCHTNNRDIFGLRTTRPELGHTFPQGRFLDGVTFTPGLVTNRNKCSIAPLRQQC